MSYQILHGFSSPAKRAAAILLLLALSMGLAACGKRPAQIDPPAGTAEGVFPREYPDFSQETRP